MQFYVDLDFYWFAVSSILITLGGFWGFRRLKIPFQR